MPISARLLLLLPALTTLLPAQVTFQAHWDPYCPVHVVESVADALLVLRDCGTKGVHEAQLHAR